MNHWHHAPVHFHDQPGAYIVTARTYQKLHHFRTGERLTYLHDALFALAAEYAWRLQAWAVFSNHYHFVAIKTEHSRSLTDFLCHLHSISAIEANRWDGTPGRQVWFQYW